MRYTKIKWDGAKMSLALEEREGNDVKKQTHTSTDEPLPDFAIALAAFGDWMRRVLEIPKKWAEGISIRGVSITYHEDLPSVIVSAVRPIEATNSPVNLHTPSLRIPEPKDDISEPPLVTELRELLAKLEEEATRYRNGERQQTDMELDQAA